MFGEQPPLVVGVIARRAAPPRSGKRSPTPAQNADTRRAASSTRSPARSTSTRPRANRQPTRRIAVGRPTAAAAVGRVERAGDALPAVSASGPIRYVAQAAGSTIERLHAPAVEPHLPGARDVERHRSSSSVTRDRALAGVHDRPRRLAPIQRHVVLPSYSRAKNPVIAACRSAALAPSPRRRRRRRSAPPRRSPAGSA